MSTAPVKLGDVSRIDSTLVDPRERPYRNMLHVGGANIESRTGALLALRTAAEEELQSGKYYFDESMVLYSKIRPYLMKVAFPRFAGVCSADIYPLSADQERLDAEYLWFLLQSDDFTRYAVGGSNRAGMPKVNREHLFAYEFTLPSLNEQRRIVKRIKECLSRVEEIKSLRAEALSEADALLPSMLNDAFARLQSEYGAAEIGELAAETRYGTSSKCISTPNGVAVLRIPNVAEGFVNFRDLKYCSLGKRDLDRLRLRRGDLLFVRTNGSRDLVGRCAIFEECDDSTFAYASYLIRVRLIETRMRSHFLSFFLNSTHGREELDKRRRTSAGQYNINSENLRSIEVPVPPLKIQDDLIDELRSQQDSVIALRDSLTELQGESSFLRESILRKAFAGEL